MKLEKRRLEHLHHLRNNKHHSPKMQNSFNKHGEDAFIFEMIEEAEDTGLLQREQHWIDNLRPEFNCSQTAGSPLGTRHTRQSRLNMSRAHRGIRPTKEALAKRTLKQSGECHWCFGSHRTTEVRRKISDSLRRHYSQHKGTRAGSTVSEEMKERLREANHVPVAQYDRDGKLIKKWPGIKVAADELGLHSSNMVACLKKKQKTCGGFMWRYLNG